MDAVAHTRETITGNKVSLHSVSAYIHYLMGTISSAFVQAGVVVVVVVCGGCSVSCLTVTKDGDGDGDYCISLADGQEDNILKRSVDALSYTCANKRLVHQYGVGLYSDNCTYSKATW